MSFLTQLPLGVLPLVPFSDLKGNSFGHRILPSSRSQSALEVTNSGGDILLPLPYLRNKKYPRVKNLNVIISCCWFAKDAKEMC